MAAKGGAVGFFDSGLGGLCILDAFKALCPHESTIYIADSKNCPYGNKPADEIVRLAERHTRRLLKRGCKMIVVACNTATAAAIDTLRAEWPDVPFIGIEPAVKPAALRSKTGVVGVLATAGTFGGRLYNETKAKFARDVMVIATVADEFVDIVESLRVNVGSVRVGSDPNLTLNDPKVVAVVRARIEPLLKAGCDKIVLGCTHYPVLAPLIQQAVGENVSLISSSEETAKEVVETLTYRDHLADGSLPAHNVFFTTGKDLDDFRQIGGHIFGDPIDELEYVDV